MAKKSRPPEDTSSWMNTYADLVTLLLCFFVLLYSMSVIDADRWQRFAQAFRDRGRDPDALITEIDPSKEPGTPTNPEMDEDSLLEAALEEGAEGEAEAIDIENTRPQSFDDLYDYLVAYTEQSGMEEAVEITKGENAIYIRFSNNIFFYPDSATLKAESYTGLDFIGDCLYSVEDQIYLININGHTASVDSRDYPISSWTLSGERATNIAIFFERNKNLDPKKLRPIGFSDNYPVAPNDTEENRARNRRVDMVIVSNEAADNTFYDEFAGLFDPDSFPEEGGYSNIMTPGNQSGSRVTPSAPQEYGASGEPGSLLLR